MPSRKTLRTMVKRGKMRNNKEKKRERLASETSEVEDNVTVASTITEPDDVNEAIPTHSNPPLPNRIGTSKVTVWNPVDPFAYSNALNASVFTRLHIKASIPRMKLAVKRTTSIKQAFFLLHQNIALVFSQDRGKEHHQHVATVTGMLKRNHMELDETGCYYNAETAEEAGFKLRPLDNGEAIVVIDLGLREGEDEDGEANDMEVVEQKENREREDEKMIAQSLDRTARGASEEDAP